MSTKHTLLGVSIDNITSKEVLTSIAKCIEDQRRAVIANVNIHAMNIAYRDVEFRNFLNRSKINFCDGAGVILAFRFIGAKIVERITYADWFWALADFVEKKQYTMYFLGAKPGVAKEAANKTKDMYSKIKIVGVQNGYFDKTYASRENKLVVNQINHVKPDILIMGMGMPTQEYWIRDNWNDLEVSIVLTGGAVFDYISGRLRRAPNWMTNNSLEWLGRFLIEPRRLWRRYVLGNPQFFYRVFFHHFLKLPLPD